MNDTDPECVARSVKDLNCVAWRQKLLGKGKAIPKELLVDKEEDVQVAIEMTEIPEEKVYERIQADLEKLPEDKQKELRSHIQGILLSNALVHRQAADAANHLPDASHLLSNSWYGGFGTINSKVSNWHSFTIDEYIHRGGKKASRRNTSTEKERKSTYR